MTYTPPPRGALESGVPAVLWIGSIDDVSLNVRAQYNPKELQLDRTIQWAVPSQANAANASKKGKAAAHGVQLEFGGCDGRSFSIELLFDGYEDNSPDGVTGPIAALETLAAVRKVDSHDEDLRRPHLCIVAWGQDNGLPKLHCVIEALSIKYTMFASNGAPLRATCTVKFKEADALSIKKDKP